MTRADSKLDIYGGRHPAQVPAYTLGDASRWLAVPGSTVRAWLLGQSRGGAASGSFRPVIQIADRKEKLLSFQNLVEVHVLASIRKQHGVTLQNVRKALGYMQERLEIEHPLAHRDMLTDGKDLFVERFGELLNVSRDGQLEMKGLLDEYLKRIVHEQSGLPIRLFPFTSKNLERAARTISIDPRVQFGRPCLADRAIPTAVIADRYRGGESMDSIARDYDCGRLGVEEAVRYEARRAA